MSSNVVDRINMYTKLQRGEITPIRHATPAYTKVQVAAIWMVGHKTGVAVRVNPKEARF